jgi:hypothetical protein
MEDKKTLKSIALVRHLTNAVKCEIYTLLSCNRHEQQITDSLLIFKNAQNFTNVGKIMLTLTPLEE